MLSAGYATSNLSRSRKLLATCCSLLSKFLEMMPVDVARYQFASPKGSGRGSTVQKETALCLETCPETVCLRTLVLSIRVTY